MDFFSNISPSTVLALSAKWFTAVYRVWDRVGSIHIVLKKSKTAVLFPFFTFYLILHLMLQRSFFLTPYISVIRAALSYFFSQTDVRRPTYSKFEITYFKKKIKTNRTIRFCFRKFKLPV